MKPAIPELSQQRVEKNFHIITNYSFDKIRIFTIMQKKWYYNYFHTGHMATKFYRTHRFPKQKATMF